VEFIEAVEIGYSRGGGVAGFAGAGSPVPVDVFLEKGQNAKLTQEVPASQSVPASSQSASPSPSPSQSQETSKPTLDLPDSTKLSLLDNSPGRQRLAERQRLVERQLGPAAPPPVARDMSEANMGDQLRLAGWGERTGETLLTGGGLKMNDDRSQNYIIGPKERRLELVGSLSRDMRLLPSLGNPNHNAAVQQQRAEWVRMDTEAYFILYNLCASRVPANFLIYCKVIVAQYAHVTEALHWGDKPATICVRLGQCDTKSYIQSLPHALTTGISVPPPLVGKGIGYVETDAKLAVNEKKQ